MYRESLDDTPPFIASRLAQGSMGRRLRLILLPHLSDLGSYSTGLNLISNTKKERLYCHNAQNM